MQNLKKTLALFTLGMFLGLVAATLVACATADKAAFTAVSGTELSVDFAMTEWGAYVAVVHPPVAQEEKVEAAYEKYQDAMAAVCDAGAALSAGSVTNAPGSAAQLGLQASLQYAQTHAQQSITDVVNLIQSFGVKLSHPVTPAPIKK